MRVLFAALLISPLLLACGDSDTSSTDTGGTDTVGGDTVGGDTGGGDTGGTDTGGTDTGGTDTGGTDTGGTDTGGDTVVGTPTVLKAVLSNRQQVPRTAALGCTDGHCGTATVTINGARDTVDVALDIDAAVTGITAAHIHAGRPGMNGGVIFSLGTVAAGSNTISLAAADIMNSAAMADVVTALEGGDAYINVHTSANASGEIRGTIGGASMAASLSGAQQNPPVASALAGTATVTLNGDQTMATVVLSIPGDTSDITAAHIHNGMPGVNGGVMAALYDSGADGAFASPLTKTVAIASAADADALLAGSTYINVHTGANGSGEIRGQVGTILARTVLSGQQQSPKVPTLASGTATVMVNADQDQVIIDVETEGLADITAAHLHIGRVGMSGGPAFDLGTATDEALSGTFAAGDIANSMTMPQVVNMVVSGRAYVNVHSTDFPGGEIRGQVGRVFLASHLTGDQQTTPVTTDARGAGSVTIAPWQNLIWVNLGATDLTASTAAHIHDGGAQVDGGVLWTVKSGELGTVSGEELDSDGLDSDWTMAEAMNALLSGLTYLNVHTTGNPSGEIRGQVGKVDFTVDLDGDQQIPTAVTTAAFGSGSVTINGAQDTIIANVAFEGVTATAAHIHNAAAGANGGVLFGLGDTPTSPISAMVGAADLMAVGDTDDLREAIGAMIAGNTYVNIHSSANPSGEIRGQIWSDQLLFCGFDGFTSTSGEAEVFTDTGALDSAFVTVRSSDTEPNDQILLELYYGFGADTGTHTFTFDGENYADCHTCLLLLDTCEDASGCDRVYLPIDGTLEITENGGMSGNIDFTLTDIVAVEIDIDDDLNSIEIPNGEVWCIDSYTSGQLAITLDP